MELNPVTGLVRDSHAGNLCMAHHPGRRQLGPWRSLRVITERRRLDGDGALRLQRRQTMARFHTLA